MNLLNLLQPDLVALHVSAADAKEVISILGGLLYKAGLVKETFIQAALDRESKLPTGLPLSGEINAAIPHTDVEHVMKPALAMATLNETVDFRNMVDPEDIVPVRLVFVMALDQPKAQIEMLQEIAGILQDPNIILGLINANDYEAVRAVLSGNSVPDQVTR